MVESFHALLGLATGFLVYMAITSKSREQLMHMIANCGSLETYSTICISFECIHNTQD